MTRAPRPLCAAVLAAVVVLAAAACSGADSSGTAPGSAPPTAASPRQLAQPPSARQVAAQIGATRFTDCGPAPLGGVQDNGTAWYGGYKLGIDTFAGATQRNAWLRVAADAGVSPLFEGPDWVAYRAVTQDGGSCT